MLQIWPVDLASVIAETPCICERKRKVTCPCCRASIIHAELIKGTKTMSAAREEELSEELMQLVGQVIETDYQEYKG